MTFNLDTSGAVYDNRHGSAAGRAMTTWSDISPFTQGYIEALFAGAISAVSNLGKPYTTTAAGLIAGFSDLTPETLARIIADCEAAATVRGSDGYEATGREFWMVRQAGMIVAFPPLTVQLGDDGKVRFA